ncbi:MAG TPA: double-CXXCG motif protein [Polyangiaceae bacterium]|nr:double-CXXCG motif protein [Polyangiaceae bacterium]
MSGEPLHTPPPRPIVLYWDPEDEAGPAQPLYKAGIPMVRRDVIETLRMAGVDNVETYELEVRSHVTGDVDVSFVAFNIIGVVAAADMGASKIVQDGGPRWIAVPFDSVVIDSKAAHDLPIFRLAENVSAIVIHDRIKRQLEARHAGLSFVKPESWVG